MEILFSIQSASTLPQPAQLYLFGLTDDLYFLNAGWIHILKPAWQQLFKKKKNLLHFSYNTSQKYKFFFFTQLNVLYNIRVLAQLILYWSHQMSENTERREVPLLPWSTMLLWSLLWNDTAVDSIVTYSQQFLLVKSHQPNALWDTAADNPGRAESVGSNLGWDLKQDLDLCFVIAKNITGEEPVKGLNAVHV